MGLSDSHESVSLESSHQPKSLTHVPLLRHPSLCTCL